MKRRALAEDLGCSYNHIYGLETGLNVGSIEFLTRLALYFDVPLERIAKVKDDEPEPAPQPKPKRTAYPTSAPKPERPVPPPRRTKRFADQESVQSA